MALVKNTKITSDFSEIIISLASPESILARSYGEVTLPETVNYKTYKPEEKGLFCERIFGPTKDWECYCGKYKTIRYKGVICDYCGVELNDHKVRRERTGHIKLVIPVAHTWYYRSLPSKIGNLLGLSTKKLDQIIYYDRYIVVQPGIKAEDGLGYMDFLTYQEYEAVQATLPKSNLLLSDNDPNKFIVKMGAEALEFVLNRLDLDSLSIELREQAQLATSQLRRVDLLKRLKIVEIFREAQTRMPNKPAWMIMRIIPVIPPDLRPLVPLNGGKFATSDLNELYRRVIIRNNRVKKMLENGTPELILINQKRMLQEAVDSLFDNSRKINTVVAEGSRVLKSFTELLKGKQGRFRQNLLGKRVDYSGRSVIVVGPELKLHECGLPKDMAVELFKPFVIRRLIERGITQTVKSAKKIVEKKTPVVWDILENVLKGHPVLLNRAPTLHRLSIQAFQPKLIEGKAIQLHPLVCAAFNADFDGDQMAVHVPLSHEAVAEASLLMLASHNILNSANGTPLAVPTKDMILGLYYLTKGAKNIPEKPIKGGGMIFYSSEEVLIAIESGRLSIHALIKVRIAQKDENDNIKASLIDTIAGRVIFNQYVPEELGFINELLTSKKIQLITSQVYRLVGTIRTSQFLDDIKALGFKYATKSGVSFSIDDITIPDIKYQLIDKAHKEVASVHENYFMGLITDNERYNQVIDIWTRVNTQVTAFLMQELENHRHGFNSIYSMMNSGARGSREQVRQLGGMRGLMAKPNNKKQLKGSTGEIIENPIISNFKEGLDVLEYFISTHGGRKGLADTALKTADAGYLTRRLVDVAKDVVITEVDCGTLRGVDIATVINKDEVSESIAERILGRVSLNNIDHPVTLQRLVDASKEITEDMAFAIQEAGIEFAQIRSVLTCEAAEGVCVKCYGRNLSTGKLAHIGEAIGVIAAQSIGEPGTQLTLRTFHVGGAAATIAVESTIEASDKGTVQFEDLSKLSTTNSQGESIDVIISRSCEVRLLDPKDQRILMHKHIPYGAYLRVKQGELVEKGQEICYWDPYNALILTNIDGIIEFHAIEEGVTYKEEYDEQTRYKEKVIVESKDKTKNPSITVRNDSGESISYNIPVKARLIVENFSSIKAGQPLVKIPRVVSLSKDITGGLPRVTELFEAREPSNASILSEIDGFVVYGPIKRGCRVIIVQSKDGTTRTYLVPLSQHILVQANDYIKAGYPISDGNISLSSILNIKGTAAVQAYIAKELQAVYRLQGIKINDKHLEIIIRQMLRKLVVIDAGDTVFLPGQTVDKSIFRDTNDAILGKKIVTEVGGSTIFKERQVISVRGLYEENNKLKKYKLPLIQARDAQPAIAEPIIQGVTSGALGTTSFISSASFQDTTRVLSDAAIRAKRDPLIGLKENVIVGHLIPTGTGRPHYQKLIVGLKEDYDKLMMANQAVKTP